jgi:hypothetical protein
VNPDSPAQLVKAFATEGIRVPSTRSGVLRQIDHPAIPLLLEYKELARLHAAHGWAWLDEWVSDGRFHPEYVVGGVVSGRWATRGGGALQIPRVLRRAVVADPGWVLVVADAAQLEPRVLAALAGDHAFAEAAGAGDLYQALAGAFGGDRAKAKVALLSAMYGGAGGEAAQLLAVLRRRFPLADRYVEAAARAGEEGRVVRSRLGRACPPPSAEWRGLTASPDEPDAADQRARRSLRARGRFTRNFVVQASAADWALVLLAGLRRRLTALSIPNGPFPQLTPDGPPPAGSGPLDGPGLVFFQHDEVIVHCPQEMAEAVVAAIGEAAAEAGRLVFGDTPVRFPVHTAVVGCYADAKLPAVTSDSSSSGLLGAAVLALGRGGRQVTGQAGRAGLDRRGIAEHRLATARLDVLVGHDDDEIDHGHEDDEVNDGRDECAEIHECLVIASIAELDAQPDGCAALEPGDDRIDDVAGEGRDQHAERQGHHEPDGDDDDVTAHEKVLEALHASSSDSPMPPPERIVPSWRRSCRCQRTLRTMPAIKARRKGFLRFVRLRVTPEHARAGRADPLARTRWVRCGHADDNQPAAARAAADLAYTGQADLPVLGGAVSRVST